VGREVKHMRKNLLIRMLGGLSLSRRRGNWKAMRQ